MSRGTLGSFNGVATPDVNMVEEVFRPNEIAANPNSTLKFSKMSIKKLGVAVGEDTVVLINGARIPIAAGGVFELAYGMVEIYSIVFDSAVSVEIYYMY
jgi:hypothetical protein